jgi:FkbM family methyltransferase
MMKLREFFYMLGLKPRSRSYGHVVHQQQIEGQTIRYADWLHPRAYSCAVKPIEVDRLREVLSDGDVAIDIGAHIGDTTLPMAVAVGASGSVIAFEANPYTAEILTVNANLNSNIGKIHAHNLAITEETRIYEFSYNDPGFMNGGAVEKTRGCRHGDAYRIQVPGVQLEPFLEENYPQLVSRIKYIKIDAEGYDYFILKSISGLLDRIRPIIQAEVMKRTSETYRQDMFEFFNSRGYVVQRHDLGENHEIIRSAAEMQVHDNFDVFCTPIEKMSMRNVTGIAS